MKKNIERLHFITHTIPSAGHSELARQACEGGVRCVQLRMKGIPLEIIEETAFQVKSICKSFGASLIINDYANVAKSVGADGVHLGKEDMPPRQARALLGDEAIIGGSANSFEDILRLTEAEVDYIGLGPFSFTTTKEIIIPYLGLEGYGKIMEKCKEHNINVPIIAIGGITAADIHGLMKIGLYGAAVSSAIAAAADRSAAAAGIIEAINKFVK